MPYPYGILNDEVPHYVRNDKMKNKEYNGLRFLRSLRSVEMTVSVVLLLLMTSCGKHDLLGVFMTFDESPNERFAQSMEYNDSHGYDVISGVPDEYRVYAMSDVHVENSTRNLDAYVADYLADTTAAQFSLCLGDLIYGKDRFDLFSDHVKAVTDAGRKIYYTAGNHDLFFKQWKDFYSHFGPSTYWFEVQTVSGYKDLFVALESGSGTLGVDQRKWVEDVLKSKQNQGFRHVIVFTHTHFFRINNTNAHTSSYSMEETYDLADLFDRYDVSIVLQGHSHSRDMTLFKDVVYLVLDAMKDDASEASYAVLKVGGSINWEFVRVN